MGTPADGVCNMKTHIMHGNSLNSNFWIAMNQDWNKEKVNWYLKYGRYRSLCWMENPKKTSNILSKIDCKKCLFKAEKLIEEIDSKLTHHKEK